MMARLVVLLIRVYQVTLAPLLGPSCRFEPSCSRYAIACVERHGVLRGFWLSLKRLSRCHPFNAGGYDPPPEAEPRRCGTPFGTEPGHQHSR